MIEVVQTTTTGLPRSTTPEDIQSTKPNLPDSTMTENSQSTTDLPETKTIDIIETTNNENTELTT